MIVGTSPPDEVRMVPQASVSVHERFEKSGPVRVLTIGAAALQDLEQQGFLAALAHELGHLKGGDTRSGWSATRVSNHMRHLCSSLPNGLYAVVVSRLLNIHWKIHHRVTNAAVRFQEVMADRVAVRAFGADAFEEGLTQVVCNGVVFSHLADRAVHDGRTLGRAASFYDESQLSDADLAGLEAKAQAELDRPTTMFDSHPSPRDRFRYARMITSEPTERAEGTAWDLFTDADGLRAEMEQELRRRTGIDEKILALAAIS